MYYEQSAEVREVTLDVYTCPSRRSPPFLSISGDVLQFTSNPHVPGGVGDYAVCAGDPSGLHDYYPGQPTLVMNGGNPSNGAFRYKNLDMPVRFRDVTDGLSNTLFIGEKHVPRGLMGHVAGAQDGSIYNGDYISAYRQAGIGAHIGRSPDDPGHPLFGSWHPGICQFVMGDGSVRGISPSIDLTTLGRLANRMDGIPVDVP